MAFRRAGVSFAARAFPPIRAILIAELSFFMVPNITDAMLAVKHKNSLKISIAFLASKHYIGAHGGNEHDS